jgi:hypothetical protein
VLLIETNKGLKREWGSVLTELNRAPNTLSFDTPSHIDFSGVPMRASPIGHRAELTDGLVLSGVALINKDLIQVAIKGVHKASVCRGEGEAFLKVNQPIVAE